MMKGLNLCSWKMCAGAIVTCCLLLASCTTVWAQTTPTSTQTTANDSITPQLPDAPPPQSESDAVTLRNTGKHFLKDQKAIWTSPARIRVNDLNWLVPLGAVTGLAVATDRNAMIHVAPTNPTTNKHSLDASNALLGVLVAVPVADLGMGAFGQHDHARETGLLGAEVAADDAVVEQAMKLMFWRERPNVDNANGKFWQKSVGVDSSFPSSHTVFAWSMAALIAGEYPSRLTQMSVYAMATGVSLTRVAGQQHFPSDVIVGSVTGWLIGHYVYKLRHRWQENHDDY